MNIKAIKQVTIKNFRSIKDLTLNLDDYSVLVGANNAGKSNILRAIESFFTNKVSEDDFNDKEKEIQISVKVAVSEDNPYKQDGEGYQLTIATTNVPVDTDIGVSFNFTDKKRKQSDSYTTFIKEYEVIYIPSIERAEDVAANKTNAAFGKLVAVTSKEFDSFVDQVFPTFRRELESTVTKINANTDNPMKIHETALQQAFAKKHPSIDLKPYININMDDLNLSKNMELILKDSNDNIRGISGIATGLQRTIIYELIMLISKTKDDKNYILLYDEPEIALHPSLQTLLAFQLGELSEKMQTIIATHSTIFTSSQVAELNSVVKIKYSKEHGSKAIQINKKQFHEQLSNAHKSLQSTTSTDTSHLNDQRFMSWINKERSQMFFADNVLLVEGITEKAVFEYLSVNSPNWHFIIKKNIYILDTMGKFEIIRWGYFCQQFGINFGIILDSDENKGVHSEWNNKIDSLFKDNIIFKFDKDLEVYLGAPKAARDSDKAPHMLHEIITKHNDYENKLNQIADAINEAKAFKIKI